MEEVSFDNLKFEEIVGPGWSLKRARISFKNRYGVIVSCGTYTYPNDEKLYSNSISGNAGKPYELAVIRKGLNHYKNPVAHGVVRSALTCQEVEDLMKEVAKFPDQDILPYQI